MITATFGDLDWDEEFEELCGAPQPQEAAAEEEETNAAPSPSEQPAEAPAAQSSLGAQLEGLFGRLDWDDEFEELQVAPLSPQKPELAPAAGPSMTGTGAEEEEQQHLEEVGEGEEALVEEQATGQAADATEPAATSANAFAFTPVDPAAYVYPDTYADIEFAAYYAHTEAAFAEAYIADAESNAAWDDLDYAWQRKAQELGRRTFHPGFDPRHVPDIDPDAHLAGQPVRPAREAHHHNRYGVPVAYPTHTHPVLSNWVHNVYKRRSEEAARGQRQPLRKSMRVALLEHLANLTVDP
jgi:hypothetical protein